MLCFSIRVFFSFGSSKNLNELKFGLKLISFVIHIKRLQMKILLSVNTEEIEEQKTE